MSDAEQAAELRPANENLWYCLATAYGEQVEDAIPYNYDRDLAAKNRIAWNRWVASILSDEDREALVEKGFPKAELVPFNHEEETEFLGVFSRRTKQREAIPPDPDSIADFAHIRFDGQVVYDGFLFPQGVSFNSATFSEGASFSSATFIVHADFRSAIFTGNANFASVAFIGDANFDSAQFRYAFFDSTTFSRIASFFSATFFENISFASTIFSGGTFFSSTTFCGDTFFTSAVFHGGASFHSAKFDGDAIFNLARFSGDTYFMSAIFSKSALFNLAKFDGNSYFHLVAFSEEAHFTSATFSGNANFNNATFSGNANFNPATFYRDAFFHSATFSQRQDFQNAEFKGTTVFAEANFLNTVPDFRGAKMHEATEWHGVKWPDPPEDKDTALYQIYTYERLKQEMERLKKHEDEQFFFRKELRAKRALEQDGSMDGSMAWWLNYAYETFSDYGNSVVRPLFWLFILFIFGIVAQTKDFTHNSISTGQAARTSLANIFPFLPTKRAFIENMDTATLILCAVQSVFGALLLFLLGLALRGKFRMR